MASFAGMLSVMLSLDEAWDKAGKAKPANNKMNRYLRIPKYQYNFGLF